MVNRCKGRISLNPHSGVGYNDRMPQKKTFTLSTRLNQDIRPQDDFFGYVNSKWLAANPIPDSETRWGSFLILRDEAWANMHTIYKGLEHAEIKPNSIEQQARDLYYTGMHFDSLQDAHMASIQEWLSKIDTVSDLHGLSKVLGELDAISGAGLWLAVVDADNEDASRHILRIDQPRLTLPDRDYYLEASKKMRDIRTAYQSFSKELYTYFPTMAKNADELWDSVWSIELDLAANTRTHAELRDVEKNYNKRPYGSLAKDYPNVDWDAFAAGTGWKTGADISVDQPEVMAHINDLLGKLPLETFKTYLKWQFVESYCDLVNNDLAELKFSFFGKKLRGAEKILPLWKRVVLNIDAGIGDGVGQLYAEKHFPESSKLQVRNLVEQIRSTYGKRIEALDWMSEPTKKIALKKLSNMKVLIGYPDEWRDFTGLHIGRTSYVENMIATQAFQNAYYMAKLDEPISRDEWFMYPQTVNAYNDPSRLVICFPAAILQAPFFDPAAHIATNLAGIGSIIGHELSHGFDDQGCMFDENGNVRTWQTKAERKTFDERAKHIIDHADQFEVLPDVYLNGKLVIGESIADLGGIEIAYDAIQQTLGKDMTEPAVEGLTAQELFFISYAITECGSTREGRIHELALSDPHPIEQFRVNGILSHVDAFYDTFSIALGDKLYRAPEDRAKIW